MATSDILDSGTFIGVDFSNGAKDANSFFCDYLNSSSFEKEVYVDMIDATDDGSGGGVSADTFQVQAKITDADGVGNPYLLNPITSVSSYYTDAFMVGKFAGGGRYRFTLPNAVPFRVPAGKRLFVGMEGFTLGVTVNDSIAGGFEVIDARYTSDVELVDGGVPPNDVATETKQDLVLEDTSTTIPDLIGNLSTGSAAISTVVTGTEASLPIVVGTPTNTYTSTVEEDGVYHSFAAVGNAIEFAYNFNIGSNASPVEFLWHGYVQGNNDQVGVFARNWLSASWEQVGTITGNNSITIQTIAFILTTAHVNTGANSGDVRIRFNSTDVNVIASDRALCSFTITNQSVGYALGSIWVNTLLSNTNTVDFVDGVADNPVSTWAAALTLSASVGIKKFSIANGSTIQLTSNTDHFTLIGSEWSLDLNGQSIEGLSVENASIFGTGIGSDYHFELCELATSIALTLASGSIHNCAIGGSGLMLSEAGAYYLDNCFSSVAGTGTPFIDFGLAIGGTQLNLRHYSGGIEIRNIGQLGIDNMSLEGFGQLILNANCDPSNAPVIAIRGHFTVTDNVVGGFIVGGGTISDDARYDVDQITAASSVGGGMTESEFKEMVGLTVGGSWSMEKIMKITTAWAAGNWRLKADGTAQELLDAEDQSTVILEQSLTRSPAVGNKYKAITVKI